MNYAAKKSDTSAKPRKGKPLHSPTAYSTWEWTQYICPFETPENSCTHDNPTIQRYFFCLLLWKYA
jgi:hypothetical protein